MPAATRQTCSDRPTCQLEARALEWQLGTQTRQANGLLPFNQLVSLGAVYVRYGFELNGAGALCCRTFELSRPWRQTPAGRARTIFTMAWSGQTVAAVAGRRLERGVRPHAASASTMSACNFVSNSSRRARSPVGSSIASARFGDELRRFNC